MAYNPYANANYKARTVETYSPGELIVALFDGAILDLNKAKIHIEENDIEKSNEMLTKAQKIVRHLNASLDMNYPISNDLRKLYTYFDEQIIKSNVQKDSKYIDDILPMLDDLKESFAQAEKINRQQMAHV